MYVFPFVFFSNKLHLHVPNRVYSRLFGESSVMIVLRTRSIMAFHLVRASFSDDMLSSGLSVEVLCTTTSSNCKPFGGFALPTKNSFDGNLTRVGNGSRLCVLSSIKSIRSEQDCSSKESSSK